ncbi:unknown [Mycoplasma sp. CAG:877]|nr:unknown [Mycoplasma sp. CAG:877]
MEFSIDFDKISEIYGEEVLREMQENMDEVIKNVNYMYMLEFNDVEDIFEREILLFLYDHDTFKDKLNKLIYKLGLNYVEKIENDLSLLESLQ